MIQDICNLNPAALGLLVFGIALVITFIVFLIGWIVENGFNELLINVLTFVFAAIGSIIVCAICYGILFGIGKLILLFC